MEPPSRANGPVQRAHSPDPRTSPSAGPHGPSAEPPIGKSSTQGTHRSSERPRLAPPHEPPHPPQWAPPPVGGQPPPLVHPPSRHLRLHPPQPSPPQWAGPSPPQIATLPPLHWTPPLWPDPAGPAHAPVPCLRPLQLSGLRDGMGGRIGALQGMVTQYLALSDYVVRHIAAWGQLAEAEARYLREQKPAGSTDIRIPSAQAPEFLIQATKQYLAIQREFDDLMRIYRRKGRKDMARFVRKGLALFPYLDKPAFIVCDL